MLQIHYLSIIHNKYKCKQVLPQFGLESTGIMLKSIIHSNTWILELLIFEYFLLSVVSYGDMYSATNG